MPDKDYRVRSTRTGEELILEGTSLKDALSKACLNPAIWQEVKKPKDD